MMEPWETVQLTSLGKRRTLFVDILEEARQIAMTGGCCSAAVKDRTAT